MTYDTRWDPSTDFTILGVCAHCQPYLKGGTTFTAVTSPTLVQVEQMIDRKVFLLIAYLVKNGYSATQTDTEVKYVLSSGVIYGTLMEIELGKANAVQNRTEQARWQLYRDRWNEILALIDGPTLEYLGATRSRVASSGLEFTGATWSEQDDIAEDEDAKGAVFPRGYLDTEERKAGRFVEISEP